MVHHKKAWPKNRMEEKKRGFSLELDMTLTSAWNETTCDSTKQVAQVSNN